MPLHAGDRAPLFTVTDLLGRRVALGDCFGYPTMIALYRAAACPLCNLRLWYLLRRHSRLYNYVLRLVVLFDSEGDLLMSLGIKRLSAPVGALFALLGLAFVTPYGARGIIRSLCGLGSRFGHRHGALRPPGRAGRRGRRRACRVSAPLACVSST
jgi:hypothetical protein